MQKICLERTYCQRMFVNSRLKAIKISNRLHQVVLDGKFSQVYLVNAGVHSSLKAPFLVLHFSYYILVTFLTILSVILLSLLIILLSSCGNNQNWFLELNLIYKTLWTRAGSGLLISMLEKNHFVSFDQSNGTGGAIDEKMDGSFLEVKSSLKMLGLTFSSKLVQGFRLSVLLILP